MIVGITGHQNLGDDALTTWVREALTDQIRLQGATLGLSSLAAGADQMFVEVLKSAAIPFEAVVPCSGYEETFAEEAARSAYRKFLAMANRVHELPYARPSEEAFFAAGKWIVVHCDLLVAVWNGLPAQGLGGTADVVTVAIENRRPWVHINPVKRSVLFTS